MITKFRWLDMVEVESNTKTRRFDVRNAKSGVLLGWVRWYGPFRGYSFFPCEGTIYEEECLRDIAEFIEGLNKQHSANNKSAGEASRRGLLDAATERPLIS